MSRVHACAAATASVTAIDFGLVGLDDGEVEALHCAVGDTVSDGTLLVKFAPRASAAEDVDG